jgi:hypothetical protein
MSEEVENASYPDISIAFEGSAVAAVAVVDKEGQIIYAPLDVLGEAFGRTAAKVFDWCLLDQQAKDCFVFGEPMIEREYVWVMRLISMDHNGVWQVWMDELCWGTRRTISLDGGAIRTAVDELVTAVRRALDGLLEP